MAVWPTPKPIDGLKSKRRVIFKVEPMSSDVQESTRPWRTSAPGLTLSLESRVAALGDAGRAAVVALLGEVSQKALPGAWHHGGLVVAQLGPHLAGPTADATAHQEAVYEALRCRPQVVVLEEALASGSVSWLEIFHGLLRSDGLHNFGGAVVVLCDDETFAMRRLCSQRWYGTAQNSSVQQQDISGRNFEIWEDVLSATKAAIECERSGGGGRRKGRGKPSASDTLRALLEEAKAQHEYWFEEDLSSCACKDGWIVTVLAEVDPDGSTRIFRGYLCYKLLSTPRSEFYIERIAVTKAMRRRGLATKLMRWVEEEASRLPQELCSVITCSALDNVVTFYEKLGFRPAECQQLRDASGQSTNVAGGNHIYMERKNVSLLQ